MIRIVGRGPSRGTGSGMVGGVPPRQRHRRVLRHQSDYEFTPALAGGMSPGDNLLFSGGRECCGRSGELVLAPERVVPCRVIEELLRLAHTTIA